ncbi:hypothetical protein AB0M47_00095 [Hamadaea sp. NPDC051192]|uniref:hypothetical protein n=1 Tax=Hamadaea sp. NPDC051192 TaxID=3154940 RepID=UPI003437FC09
MTDEVWRGTLNQILYLTDYYRELSDEDAAEMAGRMIEYDFFRSGPAAYREAIGHALGASVLLGENAIEIRHDEPRVKEFLGKVATALDARQPWPAPRYRALGVQEWQTFGHAKAIAKADWSTTRMGDYLRSLFDTVPVGDASLPVLVFQIGSGQTLAFLGSADPKVHTVTLYQRDPGDPARTIADFCEQTGFDPAELTPLAA